MNRSSLDLADGLRFDLDKGAITDGAEPLAVLPLSLLAALPSIDSAALAAARKFGTARGALIATRLGDGTLQELSDEIAGLLALMGLGRASIEVYGDALFIRLAAETKDGLTPTVLSILGAVLGGVLEAIAGNAAFQVIPIDEAAGEVVMFVGNSTAAELLHRAMRGGIPMPEALAAMGRSGGGA